jgi:c(7)-type cytochrome triheme protein
MPREKNPGRPTGMPSRLLRHPFVLACLGLVAVSASVWAVPAQVSIPIVRAHAKLDPPGAGWFSHWRHEQYQCVACHPAIFPRARKGFTHDDMDEGRFCGACHDGRTAPPASGARAICKTTCHAQ